MPHTISAEMDAHLASEHVTLATCWRIIKPDTTELGFTTHDTTLTIGGLDYEPIGSFAPSAVDSSSDLTVGNMELEVTFYSTGITKADLIAGEFDYSEVYIFMVNYNDLTMGTVPVLRGNLGEIEIKNGKFTAELRSLAHRLKQNIGRSYLASCDAELGDSRCGVNTASYTDTGTVDGVTSNRRFTDTTITEDDGVYTYGLLTWTSGNNNGRQMEVRAYLNPGDFQLFEAMPEAVQVGDTFSVIQGCDKSWSTCKATFSNGDNFRGFPHLPGRDELMDHGTR